jgi:hypothetical protein
MNQSIRDKSGLYQLRSIREPKSGLYQPQPILSLKHVSPQSQSWSLRGRFLEHQAFVFPTKPWSIQGQSLSLRFKVNS